MALTKLDELEGWLVNRQTLLQLQITNLERTIETGTDLVEQVKQLERLSVLRGRLSESIAIWVQLRQGRA